MWNSSGEQRVSHRHIHPIKGGRQPIVTAQSRIRVLDAHCAIIIGHWEEPSGESRVKWIEEFRAYG